MRRNFPFVALVGQEALRDALLWLAVDPAIGGLLVTGTRGTAKSTAARGLVDVLPGIAVRANDAFNRAPEPGDDATVRPTPFVEFPVGATEDRVVGTLDVRALLADAERRFEPGLLARANRGVLYVDEVNLLPDHLVDVVLDAAATGINVVEREGASFVHDARIMLVGTMNPEEGELRPQLLDRFGLCVAIASDDDLAHRVRIVERRLAFERDPEGFTATYARETAALRERVVAARALLADVTYDVRTIEHAATLAIAARVEGMRADLTIVRTACAIAALDGRTTVASDDVEGAAVAALAHRRREAPPPSNRPTTPPNTPTNGSPPKTNASPPDTSPPSAQPPATSSKRSDEAPSSADASGDGNANGSSDPSSRPSTDDSPGETFTVGAPAALTLAIDMHVRAQPRTASAVARGRDTAATPVGRARVVRTVTRTIAALATIRAAAEEGSAIAERHVRYVTRRGRERQLIVFVVDASGSMAAAARMRAAKGVVCALLEDAYKKRDAVALVAFRGVGAETLVPPTRSAALAYRRLAAMPTGGRTPLADGLRVARELIAVAARRDPSARAYLVLVSDARANAPQHDAFGAAMHEAALIEARDVRVLCVDTESGRIRFHQVARLATAMAGSYRHLDDCSERTLGATIREWMATA